MRSNRICKTHPLPLLFLIQGIQPFPLNQPMVFEYTEESSHGMLSLLLLLPQTLSEDWHPLFWAYYLRPILVVT